MMAIEIILASMDNVKQVGTNKWRARCPSHQSDSQSLSITLNDEGVTMINCFAGCKGSEVMEAIGLPLRALYPPSETGSAHFVAPSMILLTSCKEMLHQAMLMNQTVAMYEAKEISETKLRQVLNDGMAALSSLENQLEAVFDHKKKKIQ